MHDYDFDGEPYVVIERQDSGIGSFLLGATIGVGIALLFAPRSGADTREMLGDQARRMGESARDTMTEVSDRVNAEAADVRDRVTDRVDAARDAVRRAQYQALDAIDAGRAAATEGRAELERKIAENRANRREVGTV